MADETKKIDWTKIWSFIKSKIFIALVVVGLIILCAQQCSTIRELKREKEIDTINDNARKDSLDFERKRNGALNVSIASYISSLKDLKDVNRELYDRVKEQDGKIISLGHAIIQLKQDSAMLQKYLVDKDKVIERLKKIDDKTYAAGWTLPFKYDSTNFDIISGRTYIGVVSKDPLELAHVDTELTARKSQIDLTWGQTVENGKLRVFIESKYPGFDVKQMAGILIDPADWPNIIKPQKKHFFTGFSIGPSVTAGYNITSGKYGLVLGLGFQYSIYTW